jgi:general secretion pathway protein N
MTPREGVLVGLCVIALALLAVIARETLEAPAPATAAAPVAASHLPAAAVDDGARFVPLILARPLFALDRRPKAGPAAAAGVAADALPRLAGILIDPPQRHAIFQPSDDGKPLTLVEGDRIAGWQIQRIAADGVTLTGPSGAEILQPKPDPQLAGSTTPFNPLVPGSVPRPPPNAPRQILPGGMQLPAGVPNPFIGQAAPTQARPNVPQPASRQPGGAPGAPNRR